MIRSVSRALLVALPVAALLAAGCGSPTAPSTTTTTTTTTSTATSTLTTVPINGSLTTGGSSPDTAPYVFHAMPGLVTLTLVSLDPSTLYPPLGMALGTWDGVSCTRVLQTTAATPGTVFTATASVEGNFCVKMWDPTGFAPGYTLNYVLSLTYYAKPS